MSPVKGRPADNAVVGRAPWLLHLLRSKPLVAAGAVRVRARARRRAGAVDVVRFEAAQLRRYGGKEGAFEDKNRDVLARFKKSMDGEQAMSDNELLSHASSNMYVSGV